MDSPKPKPPERIYKVGNVVVSKREYDKYRDEMSVLAVKEAQYWKICREGLRPWRKY